MQLTRETMGSVIGGTATAAALAFFAFTHEPALAPSEDLAQQVTLNIPTIEQMCLGLGAGDPQSMMECQAVESSAGEFVIAWMGLNGFILNGGIDIEQIQLIAELDSANTVDPALTFDPTIDPGLGVDPGLGLDVDPSLDPALGDGLVLGGVTDPLTGETSPVFASPAQLALFCLGGAVDWISLQDCISMNDQSTQFGGVQ
jgi:hypothetical protein